MYSETGHIKQRPGVSTEAGYRRPTAVCVVRNLPFTTGYSALIFTQTLTKDKGDHRFLWLTQEPASKHIENPECKATTNQ